MYVSATVSQFLAGMWQMRKHGKSTKMTIFCCTFQYALGLHWGIYLMYVERFNTNNNQAHP